MEIVEEDRQRAGALDSDREGPGDLHRANVLFANQALFAAHLDRGPHDVRDATRLLVQVVDASTRNARAEVQGAVAELQFRKLALASRRRLRDPASADPACRDAGHLAVSSCTVRA